MTQPKVIRLLILGLPVGLLVGGIIAMILYFRDEASAAARSARGDNSQPVSRRELLAHVRTLAKTIGPRHLGAPAQLAATIKYIEGTLGPANLGYKVARETYKVGDIDCHNLIVELPGTQKKDEIVIVGAHYDTVLTTPGADDNASGVAACMNLAQAFAKTENERTLRFVFFANEEPPYFQTDNMGSLVHAKLSKRRGDQIVAMLSLETMGFYTDAPNSQKAPPGVPVKVPDEGNFLAVIGNVTSAPVADGIAAWFQRNSTMPCIAVNLPSTIAEQGWSDHWSFWQMGYPGVMITDTAMFRNPHYHQPTDTIDTLDFDRLTEAVKGLEGSVRELVNPSRRGR